MQKVTEKKLIIYGLLITGMVMVIAALFTGIPAGGADNYAHFNISRWAFRYPHLFLEHWGKPVFTILTSPFTLLGIQGVRFFNIVCGLLTAWFVYRLAKILSLKQAWMAPVLSVFTPIYFVVMSSGMTEVLFSLILTLSVLFFFQKRYIPSAILISFIFLVRTEGLAFLLLFATGFLFRKQYSAIPFLAAGFLLFSVTGWLFHYHDFWWLIHKRPYATGGASVYGSGDWYYFVARMPQYFGYVIPFLLFAGTITMFIRTLQGRFRNIIPRIFPLLLIAGSFWGYFFIHSYLWWIGETSAGLHRVMAGVSPMAAIISLYFIDKLSSGEKQKPMAAAITGIFAIYLGYAAAGFYHKSVSRDLTAGVLKETTQWLKDSGSTRHRLVMHNPYFAFSTGSDAWDNQKIQYGFSNNEHPEAGLPDSSVFIWDAHFSPNEGRMPQDMIMNNPNFELIRYFEPEIPFKVLGNNDYKILIFRKMSGSDIDNINRLRVLRQEEMEQGIFYAVMYDFETRFADSGKETNRIEGPNSAGFVYSLKDTEFSPAFEIGLDTLTGHTPSKVKLLPISAGWIPWVRTVALWFFQLK